MEERRRVTFGGLWRSLYPVLTYWLIQLFAAVGYMVWLELTSLKNGTGEKTIDEVYMEGTVWIVLISAVIGILLFGWLYHGDRQRRGCNVWQEEDWYTPSEGHLLWVVIGSAGLALFANDLISLTPLAQWSESYQETSEALNTGSIWIRMASVGFFAPAVEELLMRGLLYERLREMMSIRAAIFCSAVVFGVFHGNIVQGVYAFLIGLFFAWLMERFQGIMAPMLAHMSANLFVVLLEESGGLEVIYGSISSYLLVTLLSGAVFFIAFRALKNS